ncbi:MAG: ligand-binding sensor domain-containing protein [Flammeovirgaceae bacterium]|jgi:ligand-binding sensor domain-containing protein
MKLSLRVLFFPFLFLLTITSCQGQVNEKSIAKEANTSSDLPPGHELYGYENGNNPKNEPGLEIRAWTNDIHEDKNGIMWFGTKGWGVIRYDGDTVVWISTEQGIAGNDVREIIEDKEGTLWFGTDGGVTKWQNGTITNYTEKDGLVNNDVHSMAIDSRGLIWIGTSQGLSNYNGLEFSIFELPESETDSVNFVMSNNMVHSIMEDSHEKLWFGTNGGAYIFDANTLENLSEADGLCDNTVKSILEDRNGDFWFSTHNGGVCRWDGNTFTPIETEKDPFGSMASADLFEDSSGNIWIPIEGVFMFRYNGDTIEKMFEPQGCISHTLRCAYEDSKGRIWFGGWNGLYRYDG